MSWDHDLFLWLNFDGGAFMDTIMSVVSGKFTWVPLYLLLIYLVWHHRGWRRALIFILSVVVAVGLSDMVAGIFKHTGLLKHLWESFPVRLRPMHTPELEGLVHLVGGGGQYGTVSAHAATTASVALMGAMEIRRRWVTLLLVVWFILVSYSRIYLAFHFPQDILLGWFTGAVCASIPLLIFRSCYLEPKK